MRLVSWFYHPMIQFNILFIQHHPYTKWWLSYFSISYKMHFPQYGCSNLGHPHCCTSILGQWKEFYFHNFRLWFSTSLPFPQHICILYERWQQRFQWPIKSKSRQQQQQTNFSFIIQVKKWGCSLNKIGIKLSWNIPIPY